MPTVFYVAVYVYVRDCSFMVPNGSDLDSHVNDANASPFPDRTLRDESE